MPIAGARPGGGCEFLEREAPIPQRDHSSRNAGIECGFEQRTGDRGRRGRDREVHGGSGVGETVHPRASRRRRDWLGGSATNFDCADSEPIGDGFSRRGNRNHARKEHDEHRRRDEQRAAATMLPLGDRVGLGDALANLRDKVVARGVIEMLGEIEQRALEIDHCVTSSPRDTRNKSSARDKRDFAVPSGHESTAAVSLSASPAKNRNATTSRYRSGRSATASTSRCRRSPWIASSSVPAPSRIRTRGDPKLDARPPRHRPAPVPRLVRDDREQPRPERRVAPKADQVAERLHERLLHRILGLVTRDPVREPQGAGAVALDEDTERVDIALSGVEDQLLFAGAVHVL